jgi:CBS domain-containing protein
LSIKAHYTWIFVIAVITAIVTTQFTEDYRLWQRIVLGLVVALLFLTAVTIRELIFNMASFHKEKPAGKITIFAFGGAYQESKDNIVSTHLRLWYFSRFFSNLVVAAIFYGLYATFINAANLTLAGLFQWLTYLFFLFFLLHFVPAFPLDGGQILRMALWRSSGDYYKATRIAAFIGWATGLFFIFAGVLIYIVTQQWNVSIMLVVLGWVIQIAAGNTRREIRRLMVLQAIQAQDIMSREYPVISAQINIAQLIREHILIKGWHYIIVADDAQPLGILTLRRIKSIPWKGRNNTTIGQIMTPFDQTGTAHPRQTADAVFEEMERKGLDYVPVLEDGRITGVVSRNALLELVKTRKGFGV